MKPEKFLVVYAVSFMLLMGLVAVVQPAKANPQFVIAAYTYDTNNDGHYIATLSAYFDSVFNDTMYYNSISYPNDTVPSSLSVDVGVNLTLAVFCWVNGTATGISSLVEGLAIIKHNVTVVCINGTTVFSQQNFTYVVGLDSYAPMYFYRHDVILDFVLVAGEIYRVTIIYEVFY